MKRKKTNPNSEAAAPKFLELLRELREFCQWIIKGRTKFQKVIAL